MEITDFKQQDNYDTYKTWVCDKGFKISSYIANDEQAKHGLKHGKPFYTAYYGVKTKTGHQFGWHVNKSTPYYQTKTEAIEAINTYARVES